jgi:diphthamide biosynthesis protein 2
MTSSQNSSSRSAPPQLLFDDGSRVMTDGSVMEEEATALSFLAASSRGSISIDRYFEIERIAKEVLPFVPSGRSIRVALQFPDDVLGDSPDVCWLLEDALAPLLPAAYPPLVFCLGDTTVGACCPDEVAALHLDADVLVHYGHACLSPTGTLPVIYSFGFAEIDIPAAVTCITHEMEINPKQQDNEDASDADADAAAVRSCTRRLLLLYEVGYHHAVEDLQTQLSEQGDLLVVAGQLPSPKNDGPLLRTTSTATSSCCGGGGKSNSDVDKEQAGACCSSSPPQETNTDSTTTTTATPSLDPPLDEQPPTPTPSKRNAFVLGGLELPDTIQNWDQLSDFTILFIGDAHTKSNQYVNTMLRLLSLPNPPLNYWTYSPKEQTLSTYLPPSLKQQLKRRFYLTQRAKDANVFGILVSSLSQKHVISVVDALRNRIQAADKASYSFAVGKINPAKLANFAEIECFVLVACGEHSLLSNEREYHAPVITPLELDIALGNVEWGEQVYTLDCHDILNYEKQPSPNTLPDDEHNEEDADPDAPYFSLVTGKYVSSSSSSRNAEPTPLELESLPGKGQVTAYKSEAAAFLQQREYQGLETLAGKTEPKAAVSGQRGIASDYGGV